MSGLQTLLMRVCASLQILHAPRREADHFPSFVVWLESCILKFIGSTADRLIVGGVHLGILAMEFNAVDTLLEDYESLCGLACRTKSTTRGMPFRLLQWDFLDHTVDVSWCSTWLNLEMLSTAPHTVTVGLHRFLIPQIGGDVSLLLQ